MELAVKRRLGVRALLARLWRGRGGAVSVEAALLIPPFLLITCMTVELVIVEYFQARFQAAVYQLGRFIRTGQELAEETSTGTSGPTLLQNVCIAMGFPTPIVGGSAATCAASPYLTLVVSTYSAGSVPGNPVSPVSGGALLSGAKQSTNGGALSAYAGAPASCSLVALQGYFTWPLVIPLDAQLLRSRYLTGSYFMMTAATVFQAEPPTSGANCTSIGN